jgi:NAD(P)H-dependent FMN reductase
VACLIEDFALQATTYRHSGTLAAREAAQGVLDDLDAMLTGAVFQLQVDAAGGVNDVDIEALTASNERDTLAPLQPMTLE